MCLVTAALTGTGLGLGARVTSSSSASSGSRLQLASSRVSTSRLLFTVTQGLAPVQHPMLARDNRYCRIEELSIRNMIKLLNKCDDKKYL